MLNNSGIHSRAQSQRKFVATGSLGRTAYDRMMIREYEPLRDVILSKGAARSKDLYRKASMAKAICGARSAKQQIRAIASSIRDRTRAYLRSFVLVLYDLSSRIKD